MQSHDLFQCIQKFESIRNYCEGIIGIDQLPKTLKIKHFLIINTETSEENGQHWFCLLRSSLRKYEIFDSLGFTESKQLVFKAFAKFRSGSFIYNINQFQLDTSDTCGLFVLYFIVHRLHNFDISFEDLLQEIFSNSLSLNETFVDDFNTSHF